MTEAESSLSIQVTETSREADERPKQTGPLAGARPVWFGLAFALVCIAASQCLRCEWLAWVGFAFTCLALLKLSPLLYTCRRKLWRDRTSLVALFGASLVILGLSLILTERAGRSLWVIVALVGTTTIVFWLGLEVTHASNRSDPPNQSESAKLKPVDRCESTKLKLQFVQVISFLLAAFTIVLNYGSSELARFNSAKPLFYLTEDPSQTGFTQGNEGGWVMFLGIDREHDKDLEDKVCGKCPAGLAFTKTPMRYQILRPERSGGDLENARARFALNQKPTACCHMWLSWVDSNTTVYEQKVTFRPGNKPYVHLAAPSFRRLQSSPLVAFSEALGLAEPENVSAKRRDEQSKAPQIDSGQRCFEDEYRYCVASEPQCCGRAGAACPCKSIDAGAADGRQ